MLIDSTITAGQGQAAMLVIAVVDDLYMPTLS